MEKNGKESSGVNEMRARNRYCGEALYIAAVYISSAYENISIFSRYIGYADYYL